MNIRLKIMLSIVVILTSGCTTITNNSEAMSEEEILNQSQEYCLGYIEAAIHIYYEKNAFFPDDIDDFLKQAYETKSNCFHSSHLRYQLLNKQTYIMQYIGDDTEFDTNDDYYFFPNPNRSQDPYRDPDKIDDAKKQGAEYLQVYCSLYLASMLEEYWSVFGAYPESLIKINHPIFGLLFTECFPSNLPKYIYFDPQNFRLLFPGVDAKLNTKDDLQFTPHYGKKPIELEDQDI